MQATRPSRTTGDANPTLETVCKIVGVLGLWLGAVSADGAPAAVAFGSR